MQGNVILKYAEDRLKDATGGQDELKDATAC